MSGNILDQIYEDAENVEWGVSLADPDLKDCPLIYCNSAFERITGYTLADVEGRNCRFLQGSETELFAVSRLRKSLQTVVPSVAVLTNYKASGARFNNLVFLNPIKLDRGKVLFLGTQFAFDEDTHEAEIQEYVEHRVTAKSRLVNYADQKSVQRADQVMMKVEAVMMLTKNQILRERLRRQRAKNQRVLGV